MRKIELTEQDINKIKDRIFELYAEDIETKEDIEFIMMLQSEFFIDELEHGYI